MKPLSQKLVNIFNLNQYESRVYIATSAFERANVSQIAEASGIPRTAVYPSIKSLLNKGFISFVMVGKRKYYRALPPKQLESMFEQKKLDLSYLISELSSHSPNTNNNFEVVYMPGKNGADRVLDIFLENTKTKLWRTFESSVFDQTSVETRWFENYIARRVKKGIKAKVILTMDILYPWMKERLDKDEEELRETLLIPEKNFPFKLVLGINEDSVIVRSGGDAIFGALIKNVQLARTLATIHDIIWSRYKGK